MAARVDTVYMTETAELRARWALVWVLVHFWMVLVMILLAVAIFGGRGRKVEVNIRIPRTPHPLNINWIHR